MRKRKSRGCRLSSMILILAILCGFSAAAPGQNASLQLRLEKALENAQSITNVEIQYDDLLWIKGKPISAAESNDFSNTMKTSYPFANDFTRTRHVTISPRTENTGQNAMPSSPTQISSSFLQAAFDGKLYSEMDSRASMVQQDGDVSGDKHDPFCPLIQPFLFLSRP